MKDQLLVVEKTYAGGASELVKQGHSKTLLNKYLARVLHQTPNAVFVLREARDTDDLSGVPGIKTVVTLRR